MKKVIVFFMTLVLIFTLAGCGKKPKATIENEDLRRSSYKFDLKVDDKDMVTKGSVLVNFYKISKNDEVLVSTKTLATFDETVSVTGLESNTEYRCDVVCTYDKKSHIIYSWVVTTKKDGTQYDPIVLTTAEEFVNAINTDYSADAYYKLGNDIDFSTYEEVDSEGNKKDFEGLSTTSSTAFCGNLDGAGFTIKNVTITSNTTYNGLFGYLKGTLEDVNFENIELNVTRDSSTTTYAGSVCGYGYQAKLINVNIDKVKINAECRTQYVGGVVGYSFATNLDYVNAKNVDIKANKGNTTYIGGLTAYLCQNSSSKFGKIIESNVEGVVTATETKTIYYGGLVGFVKAGASIDKSIANMNATINAINIVKAGGLIGQINLNSVDNDIYVKNVVAMGNITLKTITTSAIEEATDDIYVGGLVGSATATKVDSALIDMVLDVEAKVAKEKKLYVGLIFGSGFEYHTELHKAIINGSITAVTDGSDAEAKISIHGFDGAIYIDGGDEKPISTIDSNNVNYIKLDMLVDGTDLSYPTVETFDSALAKSELDTNIWSVKQENDKFIVTFK